MLLVVVLVRMFRRKLPGLIERAKQGGAILARPREYLVRVFLPSFGAWLAKLGVIAVFLAGYGITVTFHTVMSVMGGNSIANVVSVTPGGVGVNQATNVAALGSVTDPATATAYSLGQQLAVTAWNIAFAVALMVWAFGWAGGRELVEGSYADAKVKVRAEGATSGGAGGKGPGPGGVRFPLPAAVTVGSWGMADPAAPVLIGYDGSEVARAAVRHAAELFAGRPAVLATVWEPGLAAIPVGLRTPSVWVTCPRIWRPSRRSIAPSVSTPRLWPATELSSLARSGWLRSRKSCPTRSTWRTRCSASRGSAARRSSWWARMASQGCGRACSEAFRGRWSSIATGRCS